MQVRRVIVICAMLGCSSSKSSGAPDAPPPPPDAAPDLMTDVRNCGAIGHACGCGSTSCTNGRCDSHPLADQQVVPVVLAVHGNALYWGNDGAQLTNGDDNVSTVPLDGSAAAKVLFANRTTVRGFAFDDTHIYFTRTQFNIVESALLTGAGAGSYTNLQEKGATGIAADATNTYWADAGAGTIRRAPLGLPVQTPTTIATNQTAADGVAVDTDHVYWTAANQVLALAKTAAPGTAPTVVAANQPTASALVVTGGFAYWINKSVTANTGSVQRAAVTGGAVSVIADHLPGPAYLAVAGGFVYWTDGAAGAVMRAPIDASAAPTSVVTGEPGATGLAVTDQCIYFTNPTSVRSHDLL
jgi:hypothetical protein